MNSQSKRATFALSLDYGQKKSKRSALSAFARIENHYFINDGFMRDGQLLEKQEIDKMYVPHPFSEPLLILTF